MSKFISYALAEAKKTNFDVQTLGGLKQYLAPYLHHRETRAANMAAEAANAVRDQVEADQVAYEEYRRQEADQIFARLPSTERDKIEALLPDKQIRNSKGPLAKMLFRVDRARLVADQYTQDIKSFEQWKLPPNPTTGDN